MNRKSTSKSIHLTEFLLGENILVAPVLVEGKVSRDIYLPRGEWVDQNGNSHTGPIWLIDYPADLSVLPYFIKSDSNSDGVINKINSSLVTLAILVISLLAWQF